MKQLLKLMLVYGFIYLASGIQNTSSAQVKIGVFADCQYCNCETKGNRYYRNSLTKLSDCVNEFNNATLDFVVGLGDLIDRDFSSFENVNTILSDSKAKVYQITGNHDYSVETDFIEKVPSALNLKNTYYSITKNNWQFIFLNGNEISIQTTKPKTKAKAEQILAELTANKQPNNKVWNGGLGTRQIQWMENQIAKAERQGKKVVLFCHYPLLPLEAHTLWDSHEVLTILKNYKCVKAWINGHNHAGNYTSEKGIHFVTMKGMVDTKAENAFSMLSFTEEKIIIEGFGREKSRVLEIKN